MTPDKEIVWEFHNPHRAGEFGQLVATLFMLERLAPGSHTGWLGPE